MLGVTKCPKCEKGSFTLREFEPSGGRFKMNFIQCSSCHTPVGVTEYFEIGTAMKEQNATQQKQAQQLDDVQRRVQNIEHLVSQIGDFLNRRG